MLSKKQHERERETVNCFVHVYLTQPFLYEILGGGVPLDVRHDGRGRMLIDGHDADPARPLGDAQSARCLLSKRLSFVCHFVYHFLYVFCIQCPSVSYNLFVYSFVHVSYMYLSEITRFVKI